MFRVKICGITNVVDGLAVADAGADAIGLNCYAGSPRFCPIDEARAIAAEQPVGLLIARLHVNPRTQRLQAPGENLSRFGEPRLAAGTGGDSHMPLQVVQQRVGPCVDDPAQLLFRRAQRHARL